MNHSCDESSLQIIGLIKFAFISFQLLAGNNITFPLAGNNYST